MSGDHAEMPEITVTRGRPSDDELAAVVMVLMSALSIPDAPQATRPRPGWIEKPSYRPPGAWTSAQLARPLVATAEG